MKILIIGGNRFVGLRVAHALDAANTHDLHILNRTGQAAHIRNAAIHKGERADLPRTILDRDWDLVFDFACYTAADARETIDYFQNVGRYVFISTASVYKDAGSPFAESAFDPADWKIRSEMTAAEKENTYQFGKRQAEAAFTQAGKFPVVHVRFPFILGPDDYSRRLEFHFEHIRDGFPMYLPNARAKVSVINSADAAAFLLFCGGEQFTGAVNVASPDALALSDLLALCEKHTGRQAYFSNDPQHHSPYGVVEDKVLDVTHARTLGFEAKSWKLWLPELIEGLDRSGRTGHLH